MEAGKLDDALKLVTRQIRDGFGPKLRAMLASGTEAMKSRGGIKSIDTKGDVTGQIAKVEVTIVYQNRSTEKNPMRLTKEDGEWRVQLQ